MTAPEEPGPERRAQAPDEVGPADRPLLTTDDEAQTDDPVIDPANS